MSDLQARIAEVLRKHAQGCERCDLSASWDDYAVHIAELTVAALPQPDLDTVAEAIWNANSEHQNLRYAWNQEEQSVKNHYLGLAQAAIDAGAGQ
jgi:hypothetical protein